MSEPTRETGTGINFGPFLWVVIFTVIGAFFLGLYRHQQLKLYRDKERRYYTKMIGTYETKPGEYEEYEDWDAY